MALPSELETAFARLCEAEATPADTLTGGTGLDAADDDTLSRDVDRLRDLASEGLVMRSDG